MTFRVWLASGTGCLNCKQIKTKIISFILSRAPDPEIKCCWMAQWGRRTLP